MWYGVQNMSKFDIDIKVQPHIEWCQDMERHQDIERVRFYNTYQKSLIFYFAQLLLQILVNFDLEDLESAGPEVFKTPPTFAI